MIIHSPIFSGSINQAESAYANLSGSFSGSFTGVGNFVGLEADSVAYSNVTGKPALVSGSSQISYDGLSNIPSGIISSSAQIDSLFNIDGLISGSSQVSYPGLSNIPAGIVSGSSQVNADSITNFDENVKDKLNVESIVSGSSQVSYPGLSNIPAGIVSGSSQLNTLLPTGTVSGSSQVNADSITNFDENVKDKMNVDGVVSGSSQIVGILSSLNSFSASQESKDSTLATYTASIDSKFSSVGTATESLDQRLDSFEAVSSSYARTNINNTFSGLQTFTNINVDGTASFAYIQSTTGSSTSIGEAFIILNENTPSSNFAGIKIVDSGSTFATASFVYDGLNNNWVFEKAGPTDSGSSLTIFGPLSQGGLGTEQGLTENKVPKAVTNHGHHIGDSNITDNGTTITLGSNTVVTGTIVASSTALVSGSSQITYANISSIPAGIVSGSAQVTPLLPTGVVSGSSQIDVASTTGDIALGTRTSGNYVASLVAGTGVTITNNSGEGATPTIAIGQAVATNSEVQFAKVGVGGASDATYELKVTGDIGATGDIVAYVSSDERLKNNVELISNPIEKVQALRGVTWEWNNLASDAAKQSPNLGVIAQEVEAVLPQLVHDRENGFKGVDYAKLTGLLIEAIKEQQKQIDELKSRLK